MTGLEELQQAVAKDQEESHGFHDYAGKLQWIIDRAKHYEEHTGIPYLDIIDAWEKDRSYWYMNYYQEVNQPRLDGDAKVFIFSNLAEYKEAVGDKGFYCPKCNHVSKSPYECDSPTCDCKAYGLFGTMGVGAHIFITDKMIGSNTFMPVALADKGE